MLSLPRVHSAALIPWIASVRQLLVVFLLCGATVGCAGVPDNVQRTPSQALKAPEQTALGQLAAQRRGGASSESGFALLDSVDAAFGARLALIQSAQRTLDLQYYAIHADASTELLLEALRAAAARGVRVRILLDDFNTAGEDAQVLRLAFVKGVEMRLFNPMPGSRGSLITKIAGSLHQGGQLAKRMHNKLFIGDNAWGITGGRNLGDAYFGGDDKSTFVDLDVLAAGAVVRQMSASFDRYWNDELAYPVQALLDREDLDKLRKDDKEKDKDGNDVATPRLPSPTPVNTVLPNATPTAVVEARRPPIDLRSVPLTWAPAAVLVDKPGKIGPDEQEANAGDTVVDGLLQLVSQAKQELLIISPYFVPGREMMGMFADLRRRGVAVRVLTNSLASNDAPAAHAGYRRYRKDLLAMGVELHEMRADPKAAELPGGKMPEGKQRFGSGAGGSKSASSRASLHSKAVVIDRRLSVIGSMNLDLRSQRKNSEVALVLRSPAIAQRVAGVVERSFAHGSYRVDLDGGSLVWRAPPGADFKDATSEPEAGFKLKALVNVLAPFAPEEML
ncbi:phospholipase D family protein [Ramlibacter algicola]|uniref:Phospholipase D family protein n=1 Tax=Ramlibacter algicola TaxID=2795217 RepID=A0A934PYF6_9BURK|nr:phospholipase D family protein [Ramlibacter algicola]MBK0390959.1 phospholipase D family protein [Ramlibacter algicola]